jgi:hypothetical protein
VLTIALQFIGKGCGSACVTTAKIHQTIDFVLDNLWNALVEGYISVPEFQGACNGLIQIGTQEEQATGIHIPDVAQGIQQFTADIENAISESAQYASQAVKPWDQSAVQGMYCGHGVETPSGSGGGCNTVCGGAHGIYCDSVSASDSLSNQIFQEILSQRTTAPAATASTSAAAPAGSSSALVSSVETEAQTAGLMTSTGGVSILGWIVVAGLGIVAVMALSGRKS